MVEWPSASLRADDADRHAGHRVACRSDVSRRTHTLPRHPARTRSTPADAVLYLMRHLHTTDIRFLEAFHDQEFAQATPVNAIGVLSRADEVGAGRLDAMASASRIAARYRARPECAGCARPSCRSPGCWPRRVAPCGRRSSRPSAARPGAPGRVDRCSCRPTASSEAPEPARSTPPERGRRCSTRLGLFGVRLAVALIRQGAVARRPPAGHRAGRPAAASAELRQVLATQFAARRDVLKGRSALLALEQVLDDRPARRPERLAGELERITAGAHEFAELRLLNGARARGGARVGGRGDRGDRAAAGRRGPSARRPGSGWLAGTPRHHGHRRTGLAAASPAGSGGPRARCRPARWPTPPGSCPHLRRPATPPLG